MFVLINLIVNCQPIKYSAWYDLFLCTYAILMVVYFLEKSYLAKLTANGKGKRGKSKEAEGTGVETEEREKKLKLKERKKRDGTENAFREQERSKKRCMARNE